MPFSFYKIFFCLSSHFWSLFMHSGFHLLYFPSTWNIYFYIASFWLAHKLDAKHWYMWLSASPHTSLREYLFSVKYSSFGYYDSVVEMQTRVLMFACISLIWSFCSPFLFSRGVLCWCWGLSRTNWSSIRWREAIEFQLRY